MPETSLPTTVITATTTEKGHKVYTVNGFTMSATTMVAAIEEYENMLIAPVLN